MAWVLFFWHGVFKFNYLFDKHVLKLPLYYGMYYNINQISVTIEPSFMIFEEAKFSCQCYLSFILLDIISHDQLMEKILILLKLSSIWMKILSYIVHTSWIEFKFLKWIKMHGMEFGLKWISIQHLNSIHCSTIGLKLNWIKLKRNGMQIVESIENLLVNMVLEFFNFKKTQIRKKPHLLGMG